MRFYRCSFTILLCILFSYYTFLTKWNYKRSSQGLKLSVNAPSPTRVTSPMVEWQLYITHPVRWVEFFKENKTVSDCFWQNINKVNVNIPVLFHTMSTLKTGTFHVVGGGGEVVFDEWKGIHVSTIWMSFTYWVLQKCSFQPCPGLDKDLWSTASRRVVVL